MTAGWPTDDLQPVDVLDGEIEGAVGIVIVFGGDAWQTLGCRLIHGCSRLFTVVAGDEWLAVTDAPIEHPSRCSLAAHPYTSVEMGCQCEVESGESVSPRGCQGSASTATMRSSAV